MGRKCLAHNARPLQQKRAHKLHLNGVGHGSQECVDDMTFPMAIKTDNLGTLAATFTTPIIRDSEVPALLGLDSLADLGAIIDVGKRKLYLPGNSGVEIIPKADTAIITLAIAPSGHMIIPCDSFDGLTGYEDEHGTINMYCQLKINSDDEPSIYQTTQQLNTEPVRQ